MKYQILTLVTIFGMLIAAGCTPEQPSTVNYAQQFEQRLKLKNSLLAIKNLSDKWTPQQKANLIKLIKPIATDYEISDLRILAEETLVTLTKE